MLLGLLAPVFRHLARSLARGGHLTRAVLATAAALTALGWIATPAFASSAASYQVQPGGTLSGIAQQYGVSVDSLAATNNLTDPNLIAAGQVLTISGATSAPAPRSSIMWAPYHSQFDGSVWAQSNCGPANLSMALGALGISVDQLTLRGRANRQMGIWDPSDGTTWGSLAYAARYYGATVSGLYRGSLYRKWSMDDLTSELAQGHPVILLVRYWDLPDHYTSSYGGDHYIVALGLDRAGNVVYDDSAIHGDGSDRAISQNQLMRAWSHTSVGLVRTAMALHR
jgi:murein DD-endopeptidase MepM/ murein hydrolase activator NlpD